MTSGRVGKGRMETESYALDATLKKSIEHPKKMPRSGFNVQEALSRDCVPMNFSTSFLKSYSLNGLSTFKYVCPWNNIPTLSASLLRNTDIHM